MAGYVCTVAGGKGGVGKTTTAINIAAVLEEDGYDVAVVDADLGMANLGEMLGLDPEQSIHEILAGDSSVSEALTDTSGGMTVVPGEQSLEAFADADPAKLRTVIKTLRNAYDVVLVDTGAGLSHETTVPMGLADGVLLVTTPSDVAINDTIKTADLAHRVDGEVIGVVVDRVTADTDIDAIQSRFEFPLLGAVPVDLAATENEPMVLNSPESPASDAYRRLSAALAAVMFEDSAAADVEPVFDETWFEEEESEEEGEEEEESSGRFGLFN